MTKHYFIKNPDGSIDTRSSKSGRDYTHVVVGRSRRDRNEEFGSVGALSFSGSEALAHKAAAQFAKSDWFADVGVVLVRIAATAGLAKKGIAI